MLAKKESTTGADLRNPPGLEFTSHLKGMAYNRALHLGCAGNIYGCEERKHLKATNSTAKTGPSSRKEHTPLTQSTLLCGKALLLLS